MPPTKAPTVTLWCPKGCDKLELQSAAYVSHPIARQYLTDYWLSVVTEGSAQVQYQNQCYQMCPGSVHIYRADTVLHINPVSDTGNYHLLRISPDLLHCYLPAQGTRSVYEQLGASCEVPPTNSCYGTTLKMFDRFNCSSHGFKEYLRQFVRQLAGHLQEVLLASEPVIQESALVELVKTHLQENYARTVSYEELCALTGSSKSHILCSFKRVIGLTPHLYQTSLRVQSAKGLLRRNLFLAAVACDVGFADQPHLTRIFKRYVGVTPGHYQRSLTYELLSAA